MIKNINFITSILLLFLFNGCNENDFSHEEWEYGIRVMLNLHPDKDDYANSFSKRVKMLKTQGKWFLAIANSRYDSLSLTSYIGYLDEYAITFNEIKKPAVTVTSEILDSLIQVDSLWVLFYDEVNFKNNKFYEKQFHESVKFYDEYGNDKMVQSCGLENYFRNKQ